MAPREVHRGVRRRADTAGMLPAATSFAAALPAGRAISALTQASAACRGTAPDRGR